MSSGPLGAVRALLLLGPLWALALAPLAAAQSLPNPLGPVNPGVQMLPDANLEFNISVPMGSVVSNAISWTVTYPNSSAVEGSPDRLGQGQSRLVWNHTYDGEGFFGEAKLLLEGVVHAAYIYGDMGSGADANNVTFWETDGHELPNTVTPPEDGKGLLGVVKDVPTFRRSSLDSLGTYNSLWGMLDNDWTKRPDHPIIDEVIITTAIESRM